MYGGSAMMHVYAHVERTGYTYYLYVREGRDAGMYGGSAMMHVYAHVERTGYTYFLTHRAHLRPLRPQCHPQCRHHEGHHHQPHDEHEGLHSCVPR